MKTHFTCTGAERKKLASRIAEFEGDELRYLGAPTFAYSTGRCLIQKDGTVETHDEDCALLDYLESIGGVIDTSTLPPVEPEEPQYSEGESEEVRRICISIPAGELNERQIQNIFDIVESKKSLIKKSIGADDLPITLEDGKLTFNWFSGDSTPEETQAYMALICCIRNMAMQLHRVNKTETDVPNEKYAFRNFLVRIGMVGDESKLHRRILLKNLSGCSAFRDGRRKAGADDE